jgi:membrane-associated protease RseP (regulator of RpoE activity)
MADGAVDDQGERAATRRGVGKVQTNVILFLCTVVTVFLAGAHYVNPAKDERGLFAGLVAALNPSYLLSGYPFALPLLAILLAHEFGHYFAARYHRVPASLPYFIPLPFGMLGTMGAVIAMPGRIRSRNALLDIGASGPIAGMIVALPVLVWGIAHSPVLVLPPGQLYEQEGQSLLYSLVKFAVHGSIPSGSDVNLKATALAGWAGLLLTMLNLLPFGQLDGGHIAYALFGKRQDRYGPWVRSALLLVVAYNLALFLVPIWRKKSELPLDIAVMNSSSWLVWYIVLSFITRAGGREHPPVEPGPLSTARRAVAWACLILFVLLFMPTPFSFRLG